MAQLRDTVVSGSLRATDSLLTTTLQAQILKVPTANGGTSYGPGFNGYVLISNGTSTYWGTTTGISEVGTIVTGTWNATEIAVNKGGTGKTSWTPWGLIYASANTTLAQVTAGASGNNGYLLESKGAAAPDWIQATNSNVGSTIVKRDSNGDFTSRLISGVRFLASRTDHSASTGMVVENTDSTNPLKLGYVIGTGGEGGIYDYTHSAWKVEILPSGTANFYGNATSLFRRTTLTKGTNPGSSTWFSHMTNFETGTGTDTKNRIGGYMESMVDTDGSTYFYLRAYRFTADSTNQNTIMLGCDNQGNCSYSVSDAAAFRSAISAPSTTGSGASGDWGINAATATKAKVTNFSFPSSGSQTNYVILSNSTTTDNQDLKNTTHLYLWENTSTSYLNVGASGTIGAITLHNGTGLVNIVPATLTANTTRTLTIPNATGTVCLTDGTGASGSWGISITGNCSGSSGSCTGNAATATTSSKVTIAAGAGSTMYPVALVGSYSASAQSIYVSQNVKASNTALSVSGTITAANVTLNAGGRLGKASGNLYIGDSGNSGWVLTQDICSHSGAGDTYWSLRVAGTAHFKAAYGAVWNDYAEMRNVPKAQIDIHRIYDDKGEVERDYPYAGHCVYEIGNGTMELTNTRLAKGCKIISDTFGFCIGETEDSCTPIAVTGRVLAYPYESIEEYKNHIGDCVCSGPNGTISIMTQEEKIKYPECIVGTISEIPTYGVWHCGNKLTKPIKVNGRIWIYVK